jgi:hypothetical protein
MQGIYYTLIYPQLSDILMRILLSYGGVCSFDQIYEEYIKVIPVTYQLNDI